MRWVELSNTETLFEGLIDLFILEKILTSWNPQLVVFVHDMKPKVCQQFITAHPEQTLQRGEDLILSEFLVAAKTNDTKSHSNQEWKRVNVKRKWNVIEKKKCFKCFQTGHLAAQCHNKSPQRWNKTMGSCRSHEFRASN